MRNVHIILLLGILTLSAVISTAQEAGTITGYLTDRETAKPVRGATVRIEGTQSGAITNGKGMFVINGIPAGMVNVVATFVGYETARQKVYVKKGESTSMIMTIKESAVSKGEVVVSANKRVQAVQDVPISVSILTSEDLDQRNVTRLDDALRYVSGISIARDQVSIRGASGFAFGVGSRTAVLIDGFSLLSGDNGDIKFDVMPVADVERIEIIKGAGSALYGTGALGGVVSMITRDPTDSFSVYARGYTGPYTQPPYSQWEYRSSLPWQFGADLRMAQRVGEFSYSVSGGIRSDESYREYDRSLRGFGFAKLTWQPSDLVTLRAFGFGTLENRENFIYWRDLDNATRPPLAQNLDERLATSKFAVGTEYSQIFSGSTSLIAKYGFFRTMFENTLNGEKLDSNYSTAFAHNAEAQLTSRLAEGMILTAGITGRLNWVRSDVYNTALQTIISGYAQGEFTLGSVILTGGIRADREETESLSPQLEFSPKFGMTWNAAQQLTVRASVGRGFRAPTIAERYANIRYGPFNVRPNPDLLSESSWSGEVGFHVTASNFFVPIDLDLAVFDNELYQLIEPTFDLTQVGAPIVFQNLTRARILGSELTLRVMIARNANIETGFTYMIPRDLTTGTTLKYRNKILWYSRGSWTPFTGIELQAEYRYQDRVELIDDRLSLFIPDADARVAMHIVDARVFYSPSEHTKIGLIGKNILSYSYTEIVGNLGPTRALLLQFELRY
ncbi:MAG: TonB-dependent receptor [Ignavibacteria bacterium]|nr:TonB-dependent receptor [Ignavibacteria bacterium]MBK7185710.1 TonB-dependent receptor [Ignavibacteria bacterium]MBK7412409.1 TonB-dependent receptor [Ignavibacteria bacterium]MBK9183422.1 TonB-dependent receptor [Ignavibacteria bacterium]MBL0320936.1 TonB-dependent receptor [Ignavibacteria bacterium]